MYLYSFLLQLLSVFRDSALQLQTLSEVRINLVLAIRSGAAPATPVSKQSIETLTRHIRLFGKLFKRLQQLDPVKFVKLPSCSDLILYYWSKVVQATNSSNDQVEGRPSCANPDRRFLNLKPPSPWKMTQRPCSLYAFWYKPWFFSRRVSHNGLLFARTAVKMNKVGSKPSVLDCMLTHSIQCSRRHSLRTL